LRSGASYVSCCSPRRSR